MPEWVDAETEGEWTGNAEPRGIAPPPCLIDSKNGVVWLRLVPYHLERLHGRLPAVIPRGDAARMAGLPFPLRQEAPPFDLFLVGGLPEEARDQHAYVLAPFGWVPFPYLHFSRGRLVSLTLQPQVLTDALDTFARVQAWLEAELGEPVVRRGRPPRCHRNLSPPRWAALNGRLEWRFPWGDVVLDFDVRDYEAELGIRWT